MLWHKRTISNIHVCFWSAKCRNNSNNNDDDDDDDDDDDVDDGGDDDDDDDDDDNYNNNLLPKYPVHRRNVWSLSSLGPKKPVYIC